MMAQRMVLMAGLLFSAESQASDVSDRSTLQGFLSKYMPSGSDAPESSISDYDKFVAPSRNRVDVGGAGALSSHSFPAEPDPNMGVSTFTSRKEKEAVQKLLANDNSNSITLSAIGIGLLSLVTMLGIRLRRGLQPATILVTEMKSQDPNINCTAAVLEARSARTENSNRVGWGQLSSQDPSRNYSATALHAGAVAEKEEVKLEDCPLTQWGAQIPDILEAQKQKQQEPEQPFLYVLEPPSPDAQAQLQWLAENKEEVAAKLSSHGAVNLKGWELIKTSEGFREAYEALGLEPCRDPLDAVSARPMVDKKSAVYEAVNKESRANFYIGMHNEFVGTRAPRAAMFVCFKQAEEGGEFMVCDGRRVFRDCDPELLQKLYNNQIRYSVMELPFFSFLDKIPEKVEVGPVEVPLREGASSAVRGFVAAAINAKVDFDVDMQWLDDETSAYGDDKTLQARAPVQPPVVLHPETGEPTWFCNVHSHSSVLRKKREDIYGAEKFEDGASRINKSDMYYGDDAKIDEQDLDHMDDLTKKHTVSLRMAPGDAVLVDNYQTMHGRNVFKGTRKHAVSWFK